MRIENEQFDQFMTRLQSQPPTLRDSQATADAIISRIAQKPKRKLLVHNVCYWALAASILLLFVFTLHQENVGVTSDDRRIVSYQSKVIGQSRQQDNIKEKLFGNSSYDRLKKKYDENKK